MILPKKPPGITLGVAFLCEVCYNVIMTNIEVMNAVDKPDEGNKANRGNDGEPDWSILGVNPDLSNPYVDPDDVGLWVELSDGSAPDAPQTPNIPRPSHGEDDFLDF